MKYLLFISLIFLSNIAIYAENKPKMTYINCSINGVIEKKIKLGNKPKGAMFDTYKIIYFDSLIAKTTNFTFRLNLKEPQIISIEIDGVQGWLPFIVSPGEKIFINGSIDSLYKAKVSGSYEDSLFRVQMKSIRPYINSLTKSTNATIDTVNYYNNKINEVRSDFIQKFSKSYCAALIMYDLSLLSLKDSSQIKKNRDLYNYLAPATKKFSYAKKAYYNLFVLPYQFKVGMKFPDLKIRDISGIVFSFNAIKKTKKYILIDFWATWCGPCIKQFEDFREIFSEYSEKGFQIFSYSYDTDANKYAAFIKSNDLPWIKVTDLEGNNSEINKIFNITRFPSNFLVNENGVIELIDCKSEELKKFLSKYL